MNHLLYALEIIAPIFILMVLGIIARLTGIMNDDSVRRVNKLIFWIFTPLLVFRNVYGTDFKRILNSNIILFVVIAILVQFFIALSVVLLSEKDAAKRGVMLQGMFRSNFAIFGIPLATSLAGDEAAGLASILIAIVIPIYNVLAVISLELFSDSTPNIFKTLWGIIKNPMILATVAAVLLTVFNVQLPSLAADMVNTLADITTPLAFIMLGAYFTFSDTGKYMRQISIVTLFKLLIFPALVIGAGLLFGYRGSTIAVLLGTFASPIAVSSFTMAQEMHGDEKLAGQLIIITSILSVFTIFSAILLLRNIGVI